MSQMARSDTNGARRGGCAPSAGDEASLKARAEKFELLRLSLGVLQLQKMHQLAGVSRDFIHRTVGSKRQAEMRALRAELQAAREALASAAVRRGLRARRLHGLRTRPYPAPDEFLWTGASR